MAFNPATDIPDLSQRVFLVTGGKAFTSVAAILAVVVLVLGSEASFLPCLDADFLVDN